MELDFVTSALSDEELLESDIGNSDLQDIADDGERCGICMDLIIDRGVLDCCQHWFCFACIDNWATITNLCPLCQNEFQLITCVPVYDTVGSDKFEQEAFLRDDDWCIEEKNNTLSFPSYYIDEDAVVCLDGDECKVRNGSASAEGDSFVDTSIACDSCDIWYHAYCVGFDPDGTSESTWLCPRCVANQMPRSLLPNSDNIFCPENVDSHCMVEDAFGRKVSVAVADAGETAIVVSMVPRDQPIDMQNVSSLSVESDGELVKESISFLPEANSGKLETQTVHNRDIPPKSEVHNVEHCLLNDTSTVLPSNSFAFSELKLNNDESEAKELRTDDSQNLLGNLLIKSRTELKLPQCGETKTEMKKPDIEAHEQASEDVLQRSLQENSSVKVSMTAPAAEKDAAKPTGTKRNHANSWESEAKTETEAFPKKSRLEEKVHVSPLKHLTGALLSHDPEKCVTPLQVGDESNIKQETSVDIMSIVRGTGLRSFKGHESQNIANKALIGGENVAGLRIKKIMRRTNKDKESSILVQKLRTEIREAVKDRSSKDIEEHVLDPTLLAAFRAVVAGPGVESVKKLSPLAVKAKKSLLQKGKIRESLTKKIYGSSNGRRKRAWDRDCEVEFWKYRCMRTAKPQKIETLKSVLGLLRKEPASSEIVEDSDQRSSNSILSRLYLADTSVLPRKNDIKPVSCTDSIAKSENEKEHIVLRQKSVGHSVKTAETSKVTASSNISLEPGIKVPSSRHDSPVSKVPPKRLPEGSSGSCVDNLKCDGRKDMTANSDNSKSDKRKWALEILARRTSVGKSAASDGHEDNVLLKGNFPLLAQLPADMRPVLSPARHNKVPISVRQAQLYRLTEHFLRRANLQSICRTAETELAVADAINIERMAADRSSSKLVYLNLCSQELRHRPEGCKSSGATEVATESTPSSPSVASHEKPEEGMEEYSDPEVGVALRAAGLLSDSPPNSPSPKCMVPDGENYPSADAGDKGPDDAFELGCETCTDISGDFKNDPGEEDRVDSCTMEVSEQTEDSLSKMKDVSSTFDSENSKLASDSKCPDISMSESSKCTTSCVEDAHNVPCEPHKSLAGDGGEHPAFVECEKLYDPDKEFSMNKFPDRSSGMKNDPTETGFQDEINVPVDDEACASSQEVAQSAGVIVNVESSGGKQPNASVSSEGGEVEQEQRKKHDKAQHDVDSIKRKVEAYIKEHIRPLCKSGVISVEQYRWSVMKTVDKIMKYHCKAKNANFLIKEGEKVKRLAEQYVEASQQKG